MSPWLIAVVALLVAAFLGLRAWSRSRSRREGPTADDREAVVTFERAVARKGVAILDAAQGLLDSELSRYGWTLEAAASAVPQVAQVAQLRGAARDLISQWPRDPLDPGHAFAFLRASIWSRRPLLRLVSDDGGYEGLEQIAQGEDREPDSTALAASRAWAKKLATVRLRLSSTQECVWSSLTLVGLGMMDLEPDSHAEQAVSSHTRRVLRDQPTGSDVEAAIGASLWLLSTTPASKRIAREGGETVPLADPALAAAVTRMIFQQASQGTLDQRARAVAAGQWEELWLAYVLAGELTDNQAATEAFRALREAATDAVRASPAARGDGLAGLGSLADKHVTKSTSQRIVELASRMAGGESQEQVIGGAPGHEEKHLRGTNESDG